MAKKDGKKPDKPPQDGTDGDIPSAASTPAEKDEPLLNADELHALLSSDSPPDGWQILLDPHSVSHERLPMLDVVFDRFVQLMTVSLRHLTSETVDVTLTSLSSSRLSDYLDQVPLPALLSIATAQPWSGPALVSFSPRLAYDMVDLLLGGRKAEANTPGEGRAFTAIERQLVERIVRLVLGDLSKSFDPVAPVTFTFERTETNPKFATIIRPVHTAVVARLHVGMGMRGGNVDILLPYATLESVRGVLLQSFMGEKFGQDAVWESHLENQLMNTDMTLEAILDQTVVPLRDTLSWRKGSILPLKVKPDTPILLKTGDIPSIQGTMGQKNGHIAIQVDRNYILENKNKTEDEHP